jgi:cytochrome c peroxidase
VQGRAFADGRVVPVGNNGTLGIRNTPRLANVGDLPPLIWANPYRTGLAFQALMPLMGNNPVEMGNNGQKAAVRARRAAATDCHRLSAQPDFGAECLWPLQILGRERRALRGRKTQ